MSENMEDYLCPLCSAATADDDLDAELIEIEQLEKDKLIGHVFRIAYRCAFYALPRELPTKKCANLAALMAWVQLLGCSSPLRIARRMGVTRQTIDNHLPEALGHLELMRASNPWQEFKELLMSTLDAQSSEEHYYLDWERRKEEATAQADTLVAMGIVPRRTRQARREVERAEQERIRQRELRRAALDEGHDIEFESADVSSEWDSDELEERWDEEE